MHLGRFLHGICTDAWNGLFTFRFLEENRVSSPASRGAISNPNTRRTRARAAPGADPYLLSGQSIHSSTSTPLAWADAHVPRLGPDQVWPARPPEYQQGPRAPGLRAP